MPVAIFETLNQVAHRRRIARGSPSPVIGRRIGDSACRKIWTASLVRERHAEPLAERGCDEVDLGEARAANQPVLSDPRPAHDADRRQQQIGKRTEHRCDEAWALRRLHRCGADGRWGPCFAHCHEAMIGRKPILTKDVTEWAMSEEAQIFDRRLLRARRARFAEGFAEHEFLIAHVANELAERIGAVLRDFPLGLDLGAHHGLVGRRVAALPNVGGMVYADSTFELAARCPRPSSCLRRGFASVSRAKLQPHRVGPGAASRQRHSRRADSDQALPGPRWSVHGGGARRAIAD